MKCVKPLCKKEAVRGSNKCEKHGGKEGEASISDETLANYAAALAWLEKTQPRRQGRSTKRK